MSNRYDAVTARKYTDRNGNEKTAFTRIGTMFANRNGDGFNVVLDALPIPDENGQVRILMFVPKERDETPNRGQQDTRGGGRTGGYTPGDLDGDEVPFAPMRELP